MFMLNGTYGTHGTHREDKFIAMFGGLHIGWQCTDDYFEDAVFTPVEIVSKTFLPVVQQ